MFYMDFGFPRGKTFHIKDEYGQLSTSIDGYRAYLLIIDRKSRYIWIMLTKTKQPPVNFLKQFLFTHGHKTGCRIVRTDKGGELWGSFDFRKVITDASYILEPTAPSAAFQNAIAERPNQTLGNWMRCILHATGLGPEFWSYALVHVVKVYNMLPHSGTGMTPYYMITGQIPEGSHLRIFGCQVFVRKPGDRENKLDIHSIRGLLLGYTATNKNIHYYNKATKKIKTATHVIFDEANYTLPMTEHPSASQALIDLGYNTSADPHTGQHTTLSTPVHATIQLLSKSAKVPVQATPQTIGGDAYSPALHVLQSQMVTKVPLDIAIMPPMGTYVQLLPRHSLTLKGITCQAGVINPDYTGNITALLFNNNDKPYTIKPGDKVVQLVFNMISTPTLITSHTLSTTLRANNGFGSTDTSTQDDKQHNTPFTVIHAIPPSPTMDTSTPTTRSTQHPDMPYNIYLCSDPFDDVIPIAIQDFGAHPTMDMVLHQCPRQQRPQLLNILPSHPASRIKRWRSTIRHAYVNQIEEHYIETINDVIQAVATCRTACQTTITIEFAVDIKPTGIHPEEGIPMLFSDQLNVINNTLLRSMKLTRTIPCPQTTL